MEFSYLPKFTDSFAFTFMTVSMLDLSSHQFEKILKHLKTGLTDKLNLEYLRKRVNNHLLQTLFPFHKYFDFRLQFTFFLDFYIEKEFAQHEFMRCFLFNLVFCKTSALKSKKSTFPISTNQYNEENLILVMVDDQSLNGAIDNQDFQNVIYIQKPEEMLTDSFLHTFCNIFMRILIAQLERMPEVSEDIVRCSLFEYTERLKSNKKQISDEGEGLKLRGDLSIVFGSFEDALNYYQKSCEFFFNEKEVLISVKKTYNKIWVACIYETICAIHLQRMIFQSRLSREKSEGPPLLDKIIALKTDGCGIYLTNSHNFAHYRFLIKFVQFIAQQRNKKLFLETFFSINKYKDTHFYNQKVKILLGDLGFSLGLKRLALSSWCEFLSKPESNKNHPNLCFEYSFKCIRLLNFDSENFKRNIDIFNCFPGVFASFLLAKALEARQISTLRSEQTLHYYLLLLLKNPRQHWMFQSITNKIRWEQPILKNEYSILPFITHIIPKQYPVRFKEQEKKEHDQSETFADSNIFIYDPRTADRPTPLNWIAEKKCEVTVFLSNPLDFEIQIDKLIIQTDGVEASTCSKSFILPANVKNYKVLIKVKPLKSGTMIIKSITIVINYLVYSNSVDSYGISEIYKEINEKNAFAYQKWESKKSRGLTAITIIESVPKLDVTLLNYIPQFVNFNENVKMEFKIINLSKRVVKDVIVMVCIDYENASSETFQQSPIDFQFDSNESVLVDVVFSQTRLAQKKAELMKNEGRLVVFNLINQDLISRLYKISLTVQGRFSTNSFYFGLSTCEKNFKTFEFFYVKIFNLNMLQSPIDLSDEVYFSFDFVANEDYVNKDDVQISVFDKLLNKEVGSFCLGLKTSIVLLENKSSLRAAGSFKNKYELSYSSKEMKRTGVIVYEEECKWEVILLDVRKFGDYF